MKIIALDPGVTTGVASGFYRADHNTMIMRAYEQELSHIQLAQIITDACKRYNGKITVICESFNYRNQPRTGLDLTPVELVGVVKLMGQCYNFEPVFQPASMGKGFYTDDKLKELKLYYRGMPHARDAMRHLLHWWSFRQGDIPQDCRFVQGE